MTLYICLITGANKATVAVVLVLLLTLSFVTQNLGFNKELRQNSLSQSPIKGRFRLTTLISFSTKTALLLLVVTLLVLTLTHYLGLDIERTRIFNFGAGGQNSSLEARAEYFQWYFMLHWNYSPIFGNMYVDGLTSGHGTYVHSFPAYLLTHTGIVGFTVFCLYAFFATKELLYRPCIYEVGVQTAIISNSLRNYSLALIIIFFLIASAGTHIGWTVLWFVMGFAFSPVFFIPKLKFSKVT
jgi:hypothetical protein